MSKIFYRQTFVGALKDDCTNTSETLDKRIMKGLYENSIDKPGKLAPLKSCFVTGDIIETIFEELSKLTNDESTYQKNKIAADNLLEWSTFLIRNRYNLFNKFTTKIRDLFFNQQHLLMPTIPSELREIVDEKVQLFAEHFLPEVNLNFDTLFAMWMEGKAFLLADTLGTLRIVPELELVQHYCNSPDGGKGEAVVIKSDGRIDREYYCLNDNEEDRRDPYIFYKFIPVTNLFGAREKIRKIFDEEFFLDSLNRSNMINLAIFGSGKELIEELIKLHTDHTFSSLLNQA